MQTTELQLRRENVLVPEWLPDGMQEQSVELDYVLPDYYPDFFRLLHCAADSAIVEQAVHDGTLHYTLRVRLHVLYCGEQTGAVQAVTQEQEYQKQMPLPPDLAGASLQLQIEPETAYLNCRAVNHRRIDLRGAIRIRVRLCGERQISVLAGAEGAHVRGRMASVTYAANLLRTEKRFTLSEDIRITEAQPPLLSILRQEPLLTVQETRMMAGKLIVKGEAAIRILYAAAQGVEELTAVIPFSQIVEQEGLRDDMPCTVTAYLRDLLITTESENDGDIRLLHCDLQIALHGTAIEMKSTQLLTDLYSTVHPVSLQQEELSLLTMPIPMHETLRLKQVLSKPDTVLSRVYAAWAIPSQLELQPAEDGQGSVLQGSLQCCVMAEDGESHMLMLEERLPFTWHLTALAQGMPLPQLVVQSCSYTLSGSDRVTLQPELLLSGTVLQQQRYVMLTDVQMDTAVRLPESDYALRLYFGQPSETLWEIAKRYHTAAEAIREENDVPDEVLTQPQMLLIPIVK